MRDTSGVGFSPKGKVILKKRSSYFLQSMTKLKQLSNKCDVLYSRENNPWVGEYHALQWWRTHPKGFWIRVSFIES